MKKTLNEIGRSYGCDKSDLLHFYLNRYEPLFAPMRDQPITLLEIGIAGGASLRTWLEYFPNATIVGLDHNRDYTRYDLGPRCKQEFGDVKSAELWNKFRALKYEFDIVIDDGSHFSRDIAAALLQAWTLLRSGGWYIIEDTHQIYLQELEQGTMEEATVFRALFNMIHSLNEMGANQCGKPTASDIESITFSKSLVIIRKR